MNSRSFVNMWYARLLMFDTIFSYRSLNLLHWLCNQRKAKFGENSASRPLTCEFNPVTAMTRHKIAGCERSQSVNVCTVKVKLENSAILEGWRGQRQLSVTWFYNRFVMTSDQIQYALHFQLWLFKKTPIFTYLIWTQPHKPVSKNKLKSRWL